MVVMCRAVFQNSLNSLGSLSNGKREFSIEKTAGLILSEGLERGYTYSYT